MDMQFSSEDEAFRIEARQFFSVEYPAELLEKAEAVLLREPTGH
ncbi:MAG: hypothetical protein ABGY96_27750 [bacterium]